MYLIHIPHLMHRYFFASAHNPVRCIVFSLFFSTKTYFSFGLGLTSSQSFHRSLEAGRILQGCVYLLSFLLQSFRSCFRHKPFVQQCSLFCQLIGLLIAFCDELLSNCDIFSFSFFVRCAFTCSTSTKIPLSTRPCNSTQILIQ